MISQIKEVLDEVFVKEVRENGVDYVSFVKNVPRTFIYQQTPKMIMKRDKEGYAEGHMVPAIPQQLEWTLKEGLEHSLNGDSSIVFQVKYEPGKRALQELDDYIDRMIDRDQVVPDRLPYPLDPKDPRSNPRPKDMIPHIDLPLSPIRRDAVELISPAVASVPASVRPSRHFSVDKKEKMRENLKKARAARGLKKHKE